MLSSQVIVGSGESHAATCPRRQPTRVYRVPRLVRWLAPPLSFFKLNVDGSSFGNPGRAGFGGVVRNHLGEWVFGFSGSIGKSTALHAELVAMQQGLQLVWEFGIRKVICNSDSTLALDIVDRGVISRDHQLAEVVTSIRGLVNQDWSISLEHTFREGNQCADFLAKKGASNDIELHVWTNPPAELAFSILADASGIPFLRL